MFKETLERPINEAKYVKIVSTVLDLYNMMVICGATMKILPETNTLATICTELVKNDAIAA